MKKPSGDRRIRVAGRVARCAVAAALAWQCAGQAVAATASKPSAGRGRAIDLMAQGVAAEESGDLKSAVGFYRQSVEAAPSAAGYFKLGRALGATGDRAGARQFLEKALAESPGYEPARTELAAIGRGAKAKGAVSRDGAAADKPAAPGPMDFDAMQKYSETLRSLKRPDAGRPAGPDGVNGAAMADAGAAGGRKRLPSSASPVLSPLESSPAQRAGAGRGPKVTDPVGRPTPAGGGPTGAEPPLPAMLENLSGSAKVLEPGSSPAMDGAAPAPGATPAPRKADPVGGVPSLGAPPVPASEGPRGVRATPEIGSGQPETRSIPVERKAVIKPERPATAPGGGDPRLSPTGRPQAEGQGGGPDGTSGGGTTVAFARPREMVAAAVPTPAPVSEATREPTPDGRPSVADLNRAAFEPPPSVTPAPGASPTPAPFSTGYGNQGKVALGTAPFHKDRGDRYRTSGRLQDAVAEYETVLRLSPGDTATRTLLAEMYSRTGRETAGSDQFEKSAAMDPSDPRTFYKQGNAFRDAKRFEQAIGSYLQALSLDPDDKLTLNNLGVVYLETGAYAKAAARFKRVIDVDPVYPNALLNLGILYDDHLDDKIQALKYYERYLATNEKERRGDVMGWVEGIRKAGVSTAVTASEPAPVISSVSGPPAGR